MASVDSSGNVKGLKAGIAIVTVTTNDGKKTATCIIKVGMSSNISKKYEGSTIKYYVDEVASKYILSYIWVSNANKQFKFGHPNPIGAEKPVKDIIADEISKFGLSKKAIIAVNGSDICNNRFHSDCVQRNPSWEGTIISPSVIIDGEIKRTATASSYIPNGYYVNWGVGQSNTLKFYGGRVAASNMLSAGIKNNGYFGPVLIENGNINTNYSLWPSNSALRTAICQMDSNNFIILTAKSGMTIKELQGTFNALGCTNALNIDGGGSVTLGYKLPSNSGLNLIKYSEGSYGRSLADSVYFYGD